MSYIIDDNILEELKERMDIVDLISQYIDLKKSGRNYLGLCPFHNEKTPSFSVSPEKDFFHCFGCGEGGDGITFIMKKENLDFLEAVKFLCDKYGISLKERTRAEEERIRRMNRIYEINRLSARFYMDFLSKNKYALGYLENRNISLDIIYKFGLGFAPNQGNALSKYLLEQQYSEEELLLANVSNRSEKSGELFDRFRNRIIFPILSIHRKVLGFGGRVLSKDVTPKYLNTRDTPVFHKGSHLYGLHVLAKESTKEKIVLVEGYMDVIGLNQHGINYGVASLGTALTPQQGDLIKRHGKNIYICFDGDEAGLRATNRAIDILVQKDISPKIMVLPNGQDPDDFINENGVLAFESKMTQALSHIDFRISKVKNNFLINTPEGKTGFLQEVAHILSGIPNLIERDIYIHNICEEYGISLNAMKQEVDGIATVRKKQKFKKLKSIPKLRPISKLELGTIGAQRTLIAYGLASIDYFNQIKEIMEDNFWLKKEYEQVFEDIGIYGFDNREDSKRVYLEEYKEKEILNQKDVEEIQKIYIDEFNYENIIEECVQLLKISWYQAKREDLLKEISILEKDQTLEEETELYKKIIELKGLNQLLKEIKGVIQ
ncbi:MAG: DNA primase [Tissierellia bacterium]|nr:DNA primase [Tissierellia bacterium]